jgi:hypothetical protein
LTGAGNGPAADRRDPGRRPGDRGEPWRGPTRTQVIVVVAVFLLAFFVARSCQQAQVRVSKDQAIEIAEREIDFVPTRTQIRFLRQGVERSPFWFVSLGVPLRDDPERFSRLAVVKIDANTGKVISIDEGEATQEAAGGAEQGQEP